MSSVLAVEPGTRFGAYEVQSALGAGAMGEVYRARDLKLHRGVAIKVLRPALAVDTIHLARLEREARVLASLNHPHIAAIYGLEETDGVHALVLELVEGPTLAGRIAEGPLPAEEALSIARQIADALRAAHEQGIVHRDLKPGNVKLRPDGTVKVLDFGLAKTMGQLSDGADPSSSPTLTAEALTSPGYLLGTPAYMAPEQALGRAADKRADIWAFGCVLFEMLTGRRAFQGSDVSETLAAVLAQSPDWSRLPPGLSPSIRALLRRCLTRDPRSRLGDIAAAQFVLDEQETLAAPSGVAARGPARSRARTALALVAATVLGAALAGGFVWRLTLPSPPRLTRLALVSEPSFAPSIADFLVEVGIAPDGSWVAYIGNESSQIFLRPLDTVEPRVILTASNYISGLFTRDDGEWLGYIENNWTLRKVRVSGGLPETVVRTMDGPSRGTTWSSTRGIVFATAAATGLQHVDPSGGAVTVLTRPDASRGEADHLDPRFLPDQRHVLFTVIPVRGGAEQARIAVLDLDTGAWRTILEGGSEGRYAASGHLLYNGGGLRAVAFDVKRLEVHGPIVEVVPQAEMHSPFTFDVARNGTLVYLHATPGSSSSLTWVDREGRESPGPANSANCATPRISPDGTRLAAACFGDIWLSNIGSAPDPTRFTFAEGLDINPVWTSDGSRLVYGSWRGGGLSNLYLQPVDGGTAERLTDSPDMQRPTSISPDATFAIFNRFADGLQRVRLDGSHAVDTLLDTPAIEHNGELSPDGRWLAYEVDGEIHVRPYPDLDAGRWQVSTAGGAQPAWASRGDELFYRAPDGAMMAARVKVEAGRFKAEEPVRLFRGPYLTRTADLGRTYDVHPDGQRFIMRKWLPHDPSLRPPHIVVVEHMDEELKRLAPP